MWSVNQPGSDQLLDSKHVYSFPTGVVKALGFSATLINSRIHLCKLKQQDFKMFRAEQSENQQAARWQKIYPKLLDLYLYCLVFLFDCIWSFDINRYSKIKYVYSLLVD